MIAVGKKVTLYVDRVSQQWIVQDQDGNFWTLSCSNENPWEQRQPFSPTEETELEPVPGHYKPMFGIPL
jgi:Uma2 family endonuclease